MSLILNNVTDYDVPVLPHQPLNSTREVTLEDDLLEILENDILEDLSDQSKGDAKRIMWHHAGVENGTRHIILAFDNTKLPA